MQLARTKLVPYRSTGPRMQADGPVTVKPVLRSGRLLMNLLVGQSRRSLYLFHGLPRYPLKQAVALGSFGDIR